MISIRHPLYIISSNDWYKWRLTYEGGRAFINHFLQKLSKREDEIDFQLRRTISYCPAFAKAAINEVKDAIVHRMTDIVRTSDDNLYKKVMDGELGGVDLKGSNMNSFINNCVLPDLLVMREVGIFVDNPEIEGDTQLEAKNKHPYIYHYCIENILSWSKDEYDRFTSVLLQDILYEYENGLPKGQTTRFRKLTKVSEGVLVELYNKDDQIISETLLKIPEIPFYVADISDSLMKDIADYQIALLNLESTDLGYLLKSNFPFYTEQYDPKVEAGAKMMGNEDNETQTEIKVGASSGRRYPLGTERPDFINPSSDPIEVSMKKQDQIKNDIRMLVHLSLAQLQSRASSADSKAMDDRGLEAGLATIGLTLQQMERKIVEYWNAYRKIKITTTVIYPQNYSLKTQKDRDAEAKELLESIDDVPSLQYKKEICKKIVTLKLGAFISQDVLQQAYTEIDNQEAISSAEVLIGDIEAGIIDMETASKVRCYPEGVVEKAKKEHAERLARIAQSQSEMNAARGVTDAGDKGAGNQEKKNSQNADKNKNAGVRKVRGNG